MYHPSIEGILRSTCIEEVRAIIYHINLSLTSKDRIKLLWQAFCAATTLEHDSFSWTHVRCISIVLLEELLLDGSDPDQLGVACGHVILLQNADLECFTYLFRYSLQCQSSPAIRAVLCWGLLTLPIHTHKELWETIITYLSEICLVCPLILIWYWLLHCYEYDVKIGATFLRHINSLVDVGTIDITEYYLLKSLTYTALLTEQHVFPLNKNIKIINMSTQELFQSDGEFILHIMDKQVLGMLTNYPGGEVYFCTFLDKCEYLKKSIHLRTSLLSNSTGITTSENPSSHIPSNLLVSSLLRLIRQVTEYCVGSYSLITPAHIELEFHEAIFSPEHIAPILLGLQNIGILSYDDNISLTISNNNFWVNPLCKASWSNFDKSQRHKNLIEILSILTKCRREWPYLKPWVKLFSSIATDLVMHQIHSEIIQNNLLYHEPSIVDILGAVHPILPAATLVHVVSHASTESLSLLAAGLYILLSHGWIMVFLKEASFLRSPKVSEATDERKFIVDTFYSLLLPVFKFPLSYMGYEMQLFDRIAVPRLLKTLVFQIQWTGKTKHLIELTKTALINEWLTLDQWDDIVEHTYQVLKVEANLWSPLKDLALIDTIMQIGIFILDLYPDTKKKTIDYLLDQLTNWYNEFNPTDKGAVTFAATSIKTCLAKIDSNEEKAEACFNILCRTQNLNDITLAVIDVILNIEGGINASTRDRLAMLLERYIS